MLIPALGVRERELHTATEDCLGARAVHRAWFLSGQVATGEQEAARGTDDEGDPESDFEEEYHPYDSDEDDHEEDDVAEEHGGGNVEHPVDEGAREPKVPLHAEAAPSLPRPSLARGPPVEPVIARAMPACRQCTTPSLKTRHTCARAKVCTKVGKQNLLASGATQPLSNFWGKASANHSD